MTKHHIHQATFSWRQLGREALKESVYKLDPRKQIRNPVMFVVYMGAILVLAIGLDDLLKTHWSMAGFALAIDFWLWLTVFFANFSEALAEGQGKAQAASLRQARQEVTAKRLREARRGAPWEEVAGATLRPGDLVVVEAGDAIPVGLSDSHHHWRPAPGHRHCRHHASFASQRGGQVGTGHRGGG